MNDILEKIHQAKQEVLGKYGFELQGILVPDEEYSSLLAYRVSNLSSFRVKEPATILYGLKVDGVHVFNREEYERHQEHLRQMQNTSNILRGVRDLVREGQ